MYLPTYLHYQSLDIELQNLRIVVTGAEFAKKTDITNIQGPSACSWQTFFSDQTFDRAYVKGPSCWLVAWKPVWYMAYRRAT
jgi:hypothetical protein